jgi:hypothetical protein
MGQFPDNYGRWCHAGWGPQSPGQLTLARSTNYIYCPRNSRHPPSARPAIVGRMPERRSAIPNHNPQPPAGNMVGAAGRHPGFRWMAEPLSRSALRGLHIHGSALRVVRGADGNFRPYRDPRLPPSLGVTAPPGFPRPGPSPVPGRRALRLRRRCRAGPWRSGPRPQAAAGRTATAPGRRTRRRP